MVKLFFNKLKTLKYLFLFAVFAFGIFGFGDDNKIKYNSVRNIDAAEFSCKGPADVILVVDRSATMGVGGKFDIVKTASIDFINKLFLSPPNEIYGENAYHQIGLVAFHNFVNSEALNKNNDSYMQGVISQSDGILGDSYPVGYNKTAAAISKARDSLDPLLMEPVNPLATKTMIVLTDGYPYYSIEDAKANADSAKNDKGIRIISVGLKLDSILDETERAKAEDFIKYIASDPFDCYYVSDSGGVLEGCNSISAANLASALDDVYGSITAAICDESPPSISISRKPSGTLYDVDNLIITSTATDDVGFKSHSIRWSDDWSDPNTIRNIECSDLLGATVECDTGEIGLFSPGVNISYRSLATDANDNEAVIEAPDPRNVIVSNVVLTVPELIRNENKIIEVEISNYGGNDEIFISIDAPILGGVEIDKVAMNCLDSGSTRTCTYIFNTIDTGDGCLDWTDGITGGFANNIDVNIYIYAQSSDVGIRQIASSENNLLVSGFEGDSWTGTCSDNVNNDCDYDIFNDPIIDEEEMLCDTGAPSIGISRVPSGDVNDENFITFTSVAGDSNGIKQHTIFYRENNGVWQAILGNGLDVCNDANADDLCDEDASQNIASISATIGLFVAGTAIDYYSEAVDYSGNDNTSITATESFIVKNKECEGVGYLGDCLVTENAKCCDGVCNATISNPNSYDTDFCAQEICNGISWEWGPANNTAICSASGNATECHSFSSLYGPPPGDPTYFFDGGCEERDYACSSGFCVFSVTGINKDHCVGGGSLTLNDYECSGNSCVLDPAIPADNNICDVNLDSLSVNAYNSDSPAALIAGSSWVMNGEVLDDLTDKVSLESIASDINGISEQEIYWKKSTDANFSVKNCDVSLCGISPNSCNCAEDIGPLNVGEQVIFYASSKDDSVNQTKGVKGPNGLRYYYYDGTGFNTFKGSDVDTNLNHTWGYGQVSINGNSWENQYNTASIIWEGMIKPDVLGMHIFYLYSDDGIRLDIDGNRLIDYWGYSSSEYSATYNFVSLEPVSIRIEWYEGSSVATMRLGWEEPGGVKTYPIPLGNLISSYSFDVYDHECYDIPGGNKIDSTSCDSGNGMCCDGTCDSSIGSTSLHEDCRVDSCSGTNWVSVAGNEGNNCGATDSCFNYYSPNNSFYGGCITGGNKCFAGSCDVSPSLTGIPACSGNLLTNYSCDPDSTGECKVKDSDVICSDTGDYDGDSLSGGTVCNCDCDNYDIEEKVYSSLSFDGTNDYVEIPDDSSLNPEKITLEAWVYPTNFYSYGNIINKRYPSQYILRFYSNTGRVQGYIYDGGWRYCTTSSDVAASLNQWNHIVHTYDGTKGRVYINNVEGCTYSHVGALDSGDSILKIGSYYTISNRYERVEGKIDDVRIYDRALYPEEVQDHYNGIFADDTGLVGHWDFDEGKGETVDDTSGNNNNGTLKNGPQWMKYGHGSDKDKDDNVIDVLKRNVPAPWQVCTDGKDNDCDGATAAEKDEYDNSLGVSNCDGEVDEVFATASANDRNGVENSDLFSDGLIITTYDIDIEKIANDFAISSFGTTDEFLIKKTIIEWTIDDWANRGEKICNNTGVCEVCIEGGTCGGDNDDILASSLAAGNTFSFRVCAWDDSVNNNQKCTDYYSIVIESSNLVPEITDLSILNHNFCANGLGYVLDWTFSDSDGDSQKSYEIQIKENDNNFSDLNELVVNVKKDVSSSYYQILSSDFINGKEMEYGEKVYYWRARVTDNRGGGYEKTSDWVEYNDSGDSDGDGNSETFTTPKYQYPQVDFSAAPDYSEDCLYETGYESTATTEKCAFGENIIFSDNSDFVNCDNPNDKRCRTSSAANCDVSTGFCVACSNNSECAKFNSSLNYTCNLGNGICEASGSCVDDTDCKTADAARCDINTGLCVACDDDSQCSNDKFGTTGIDYFCDNVGKCDDRGYREWYFYGSDVGDPNSVDSNPINNYIEFDYDDYSVILKITDINNHQCYKIKKILLGANSYPKWNESPASNN